MNQLIEAPSNEFNIALRGCDAFLGFFLERTVKGVTWFALY
jgi:hypothetical protein